MQALKDEILREGKICPNNIVKVDSFFFFLFDISIIKKLKKGKSLNQSTDFYEANVFSYTRGEEYGIRVSKEYMHDTDNVLIIDDFLANGAALRGLIKIVNDANAKLVGCGIVIEKGFQPGGRILREQGIRIESLAIIDKVDEIKQTIEFRG